MPTYVFLCAACGERFELTMSVAQRSESVPPCPKCHSAEVKAILSGFFAKTSRKS